MSNAHRAEQPRLLRSRLLLWATVATVVLIAGGIVATLWAGGRFGPGRPTDALPTAVVTADPVVDTSYTVVVLNATPQEGLGGTLSADIIAAGWSADDAAVSGLTQCLATQVGVAADGPDLTAFVVWLARTQDVPAG